MGARLELQTILEELLGSENVYFQPPETVKLEYPCIIFSRAWELPHYADNVKYLSKKRYSVMVIDRDPDSEIPDKVSNLPLSRFDRHYTTNNLNHDVYDVYY